VGTELPALRLGLSTTSRRTYFNLLARYRRTWDDELGASSGRCPIGSPELLAASSTSRSVPTPYFFVRRCAVQLYPVSLSRRRKDRAVQLSSAQAGSILAASSPSTVVAPRANVGQLKFDLDRHLSSRERDRFQPGRVHRALRRTRSTACAPESGMSDGRVYASRSALGRRPYTMGRRLRRGAASAHRVTLRRETGRQDRQRHAAVLRRLQWGGFCRCRATGLEICRSSCSSGARLYVQLPTFPLLEGCPRRSERSPSEPALIPAVPRLLKSVAVRGARQSDRPLYFAYARHSTRAPSSSTSSSACRNGDRQCGVARSPRPPRAGAHLERVFRLFLEHDWISRSSSGHRDDVYFSAFTVLAFPLREEPHSAVRPRQGAPAPRRARRASRALRRKLGSVPSARSG